MALIQLAVEQKRWDLAALTIVLAIAKILIEGDKPHAGKKRKKQSVKGQPEQ